MALIKCMCRFGCVLWLEYSPLNVPPICSLISPVPLHHPRSTERQTTGTHRNPPAHRGMGEGVQRKSRWREQNSFDTTRTLDHYPSAGWCRLAVPGAAVCRGIVQGYLLSNKDERAEVHCLIPLWTNHHPNFSSSFGVGMPHTPATGLHLPPCPRLYHVTRHGQWETGGHLSTHFLLLDKASGPRHSLLFYQELWSLHYTNANMCKLWAGRR